MTRNIQCRDMIEDVQRQISGLSFQDGRNSSTHSYSSQPGPTSTPNTARPQAPYYQAPQSGYGQQPPPYNMHPPSGGSTYPPQQPGQQPGPAGHEYGQPAYPGWQGSYYNPQSQGQQPPYHNGYYKQ